MSPVPGNWPGVWCDGHNWLVEMEDGEVLGPFDSEEEATEAADARSDEPVNCGALTEFVDGAMTAGWHICEREPGHDGPHRCDICPHEWHDPTPAAAQEQRPDMRPCSDCGGGGCASCTGSGVEVDDGPFPEVTHDSESDR